jgi:hypothetical protein
MPGVESAEREDYDEREAGMKRFDSNFRECRIEMQVFLIRRP